MKPDGVSQSMNQTTFMYRGLSETLNPKHHLVKLAEVIDWSGLEREFMVLYSQEGRKAKPIRLMVGLLILKQMYNLSDEEVVLSWEENGYWQYFTGESELQWCAPCAASELTHFRNRIGERGVERIFQESVRIHGESAKEETVVSDGTVQEKNITPPTDSKQALKVIEQCWRISKEEGLKLRQSYRRVVKKLRWKLRYHNHRTRSKEAHAAKRKLKTIAGRLVRDVERNLALQSPQLATAYAEKFTRFHRVLEQQKHDHKKTYSLHEPHVACFAKGKAGKKYEFGSLAMLTTTAESGVIVGAKNFHDHPYESNTIVPVLEQVKRMTGKEPKRVLTDEGIRGIQSVGNTEILRVHQQLRSAHADTPAKKRRARKLFGRRASIEPRIGHLKSDYGLDRTYLKGTQGDSINLMMAAAAANIWKFIDNLENFLFLFFRFLRFCF